MTDPHRNMAGFAEGELALYPLVFPRSRHQLVTLAIFWLLLPQTLLLYLFKTPRTFERISINANHRSANHHYQGLLTTIILAPPPSRSSTPSSSYSCPVSSSSSGIVTLAQHQPQISKSTPAHTLLLSSRRRPSIFSHPPNSRLSFWHREIIQVLQPTSSCPLCQ